MDIRKIAVLLLSAILILVLTGCSLQTPANSASPQESSGMAQERQDTLIPIAKGLVDDLSKGNWQSVYDTFDDTMKKALPVEKLPSVWQQGLQPAGAFGSSGEAKALVQGGYEMVIVTCPSEKANLLVRVVFSKENKVSGLWFNTSPLSNVQTSPSAQKAVNPPEAVTEEAVTVGQGGEWPLPGALTLPKNAQGQLPAVVLVQGSGSNDRDETVGEGKPFRDIAWGLASRGIAVLRYDKRTYAYKSKFIQQQISDMTVQQEVIDDAIAAANLLKQDVRIDKSHIFLIGHSMGAMLAPRIETSGGDFAGIVMLAGSPRKLWEIQYDQNISAIQTLSASDKEAAIKQLDTEKAKAEQLDAGDATQARQKTVFGLPGYYQWEMDQHDAGTIAQGIAKPMLCLQGDKDIQVSPEKDFGTWKTLLSGKANATFKLYPGLTHFFSQDDGTFSLQKPLGTKPIAVSDAVISDMAGWILNGKLQ